MEEENILLIEHDLATANSISHKLLPSLGYKSHVATDGKSALWIVRSHHISLILLDSQLPDMTPREFLRQLNSEELKIPTILIASHAAEKVDVGVFRLGVQEYLIKPLDQDSLQAAINRVKSVSHLQQEKSKLTEQLIEQISWMKALTKVGQSVTSTLDLDIVLRRIVEAGVELTHAEEGFLALLDEMSGQLYLRAAKNMDEDKTKTMRMPVNDTIIGQVVRTGRPIRTTQMNEQPALKVVTGFLVHNLLHVPLVSKGKVLGVLSVDNQINTKAFTELDEAQLTSLADYAAVAIENADLYQRAQQEIKERKDAEAKILHDALHDALTGMPNRALFMDRLEQALERSKRRKDELFAVLYLDLDRFKNVNDSLGHSKGDQLLITVANTLQALLRPTDTVARLGGDEFAILLEEIHDISDASRIADRIQGALNSASLSLNRGVFITTSIGIVLSASGYSQPEDMLRDADIAMYRAKALGKARYEIFDPAMRERTLERLKIEADLRMALERDELRVHYQPIVSLATGRVAGFEALVRWQHPERGLLRPGEFIPIAAETGLIIAIDYWVLREACRQVHSWQEKFSFDPPLIVSVNITGRQVAQPDLLEKVQKILLDTGLAASQLKLELTENAIMENSESTVTLFSKLQALGVNIQIDDFGVGYSSLSYLSNFPINALKIDQSFVQKITLNKSHSKIIQSIVMLARGLDMTVTSEGVETMEQFDLLRQLGCEYGQGAYISMPLDPQAAYDFMLEKRAAVNLPPAALPIDLEAR